MEISKILEYYKAACKDVVNALQFILLLFACFFMLHTDHIDNPFTVKTTKKSLQVIPS